MQAIIAILFSLGLITSPDQVSTSTSLSVSAANTYTVNVDGTPVIIDIQEF